MRVFIYIYIHTHVYYIVCFIYISGTSSHVKTFSLANEYKSGIYNAGAFARSGRDLEPKKLHPLNLGFDHNEGVNLQSTLTILDTYKPFKV